MSDDFPAPTATEYLGVPKPADYGQMTSEQRTAWLNGVLDSAKAARRATAGRA